MVGQLVAVELLTNLYTHQAVHSTHSIRDCGSNLYVGMRVVEMF